MMHCRITLMVGVNDYTLHKHADRTVEKYFPAFTRVEGIGIWEGERDITLVYTILHPYDVDVRKRMVKTAEALAVEMNQTCVLAHLEIVNPPILVGQNGIMV